MWWSYVKIFKNSKALYESWKSQEQFYAQDISALIHFYDFIKSSEPRQRIGRSHLWVWFTLSHVWSHAFALKKGGGVFILSVLFKYILDIHDQIATAGYLLQDTSKVCCVVSLKAKSYLFFIWTAKQYSRHCTLKLFSSSSKGVLYNEMFSIYLSIY